MLLSNPLIFFAAFFVDDVVDPELLHPLARKFVVGNDERKEKSNYGIKPKLDGPRDEKCNCSSYTLSSEL